MSRREQLQAIVLRSFDVGDADRFCICLTREHGRIAARAKGVRKMGSHMGGCLLPFHRVMLDITESSAGFIVTGAQLARGFPPTADIRSFAAAHEATELVIALLQEEDPLPEVFDALETFLAEHLDAPEAAYQAFTFHLLFLLGFLPDSDVLGSFGTCGIEEQTFIAAAIQGECAEVSLPTLKQVRVIATTLLSEHLLSPLKATPVAAELNISKSFDTVA